MRGKERAMMEQAQKVRHGYDEHDVAVAWWSHDGDGLTRCISCSLDERVVNEQAVYHFEGDENPQVCDRCGAAFTFYDCELIEA
jgi:hypothetical protein